MSKKIYFDMDGTVYDLYSVPQWLERLRAEQPRTFLDGEFMFDPDVFSNLIEVLIMHGYTIGIISWLPMQATPEYEEICRAEKIQWINEHMPYVSEINIASYGTPKQKMIQKRSQTMILIDDNAEVCKMWETNKMRIAYNVDESFSALEALEELVSNL